MRIFGKTNIDFISIRRGMYFFSAFVIVVGIVSLFTKGIEYGIDFEGGSELVLSFDQPPTIGELRNALGAVGLGKSEIKYFGTEGDVLIRTRELAEGMNVNDQIKSAVRQSFPGRSFEVSREYKIFPKIGEELQRNSAYAILASLVVILGYIGFRFRFVYGVGAVLALFHDVLVTLGIISILGGVFPMLNLELNQEVVAAFLTLVGVSVNDTVVVFDRIRENLKVHRSLSFHDIVNKSLNETLSRTIITSGTLFIVLLTLLLVGGEVTRGFAFTLTIGIITGTYSSIYIASATVLDWTLRKKKDVSAVS
jgi:preprotein translocase subunit SecF